MKNFIFLSALAAASLSASAQHQQVALQAKPFDLTKGLQTLQAAPANMKASVAKRSIEDGVLYGRPKGCYHSGYSFGQDGSIPAYLLPGLAPVTYPNWCTNPGAAVWSVEGSESTDLSDYTDLDNNLVMKWGANPYIDTEKDIIIGFTQPTISVGNSSFTPDEVTAVANDVTPTMNFSPLVKEVYIGYSDGPAYGTGSVYEQMLIEDGSAAEIGGTVMFFEQPPSPMYTEAFQLPFTSYQEDPLAGKSLTLSLYTYEYVEGVGYQLLEKKEELTCSSADVMGSNTNQSGEEFWYGNVTFYKETQNEFGDVVADPFTVDYPYAVKIEGYNQEGVDVEFRLVVIEDPYLSQTCRPARFEAVGADGSKAYYYFGGQDGSIVSTLMYTYCFFDGVEPVNDYFTSLYFSEDGKTCGTDHGAVDSEKSVSYIPVVTAAPFFSYDENGDPVGANYDVVGLPEWLSVGVSDEPREQAGYSALIFECQPLPAGVEGRYADIYVVGRGGVKNAKPFRVRQGSVAGIENVEVENGGKAVLYNAAGQRVNNANGFVIANGKKTILK